MTREPILAYVQTLRADAYKRGLPVMREETARKLFETVRDKGAKRVLDVGTCVGVSALTAIAAGADRVTTLEKDETRLWEAKEHFARCGVTECVTTVPGDCTETLSYLDGNTYDLIVLDGPKSTLSAQFERCLAMLPSGGVIFIDDVLYHGYVRGEGAPHKQRTIITNLRRFLSELSADTRVKTTFYEEEDGFAVVEKK